MQYNKEELKVEAPCRMRWSELKGDGSKRWCDECALHVIDGASLTQTEATDLVKESADRVCMRIVLDADGSIVHAEEAPRAGVMGRVLRYGLTAAAGLLVACGDEQKEPADETPPDTSAGNVEPGERPVEIMGEVFFPEEGQTEEGQTEEGQTEEGQTEELGKVSLPVGDDQREIVGTIAVSPLEIATGEASAEEESDSAPE